MPKQKSECCCKKRRLVMTTAVVGGVGVAVAAAPFIASMLPTDQQKALAAPIDVDISKLFAGDSLIVQWRGQPIWIVKRTEDMMKQITGHDDDLADPLSERGTVPDYCKNEYRARKEHPDILVTIGVCTHLGCSPIAKLTPGAQEGLPNDWPGGFLCPCHGSTFDIAGRVFKNKPAPDNLAIPPYRYLAETRIRIGEDEKTTG